MWEWLIQLLRNGATGEALAGAAGELAMQGAPNALAQAAIGGTNLAGITPPAPVPSWDQIVNPGAQPLMPQAIGGMSNPGLMQLPSNGMITLPVPGATEVPIPQVPNAPSFGPTPYVGIPPSTYEGVIPGAVQQPRPSVGLTPNQMLAMMKMMDGGQQQQQMRAPAAHGGQAARPPGAAQWVVIAPTPRVSLADLLRRR
jgi:hypothetical protein